MADNASFAKLVPGFEFLQGLVKNAGSALPSIGNWIAPTLDPAELEKRIDELRTVQFWLEQNARMLGATIQALEVQRMTLSTLKTMNVQMNDLRESLTIKPPKPEAPAPSASTSPASTPPAQAPKAAPQAKPAAKKAEPASAAGSVFASIDPMQAWSALTQQFTQIAASAMKDTATEAAKNMAGTMVKQSFDAAGQTLKQAVNAPMKAAKAAGSMASTMAGNAAGAAAKAAQAARGGTRTSSPSTRSVPPSAVSKKSTAKKKKPA